MTVLPMINPTWCYDKAGEATLHDLASGEGPPDGLSLTPPPGTHPHEREEAARTQAIVDEAVAILDARETVRETSRNLANPPEIPRETAAEPVKRGPGRPPKVQPGDD
jgi:hypothetical protein